MNPFETTIGGNPLVKGTGNAASTPVQWEKRYSVYDGTNLVTATRTINVATRIAPVITLINDNDAYNQVQTGDTWTDPGATATESGTYGSSVVTVQYLHPSTGAVHSTLDTSISGTWTVRYTASNADSLSTSADRSVIVAVQNLAPTVTLNGASTINLAYGDPFVEPGVTIHDPEGQTLSLLPMEQQYSQLTGYRDSRGLLWFQTVNTTNQILGDPINAGLTYVARYTVVDGPHTVTATRTIHVAAPLPPVITIINDHDAYNEVVVNGTWTDPGASATESGTYGSSNVSVQYIHPNTGTAQPTLDTSVLGTWTVRYSASNWYYSQTGNAYHLTTADRSVWVKPSTENVQATLTLNGGTIQLLYGATYNDPGFQVDDPNAGITNAYPTDANVTTDFYQQDGPLFSELPTTVPTHVTTHSETWTQRYSHEDAPIAPITGQTFVQTLYRTIVVAARGYPHISLLGSDTINHVSYDQSTATNYSYTDPGAIAYESAYYGGAHSVSLSNLGTIDISSIEILGPPQTPNNVWATGRGPHIFSGQGAWTVRLSATNADGLTSTRTRTVNVT